MYLMKRTYLSVLNVVLLAWGLTLCQVHAQPDKFTEKDAAGMNYALYPKSMNQLQWKADEAQFSWVDDQYLLSGRPQDTIVDTLLSLSRLNQWITEINSDSLSRMPFIQWEGQHTARIQVKEQVYRIFFDQQKLQQIALFPKEAQNKRWNPQGDAVAFTVDNNLFLLQNNELIQLTDEPDGVLCGQTVHRNEFGINGGLFWSPDGKKIAYYRMDERMVAIYPIVDVDTPMAELKQERYPMAGMTSHEVKLYVYDIEAEITTSMQTEGPADQYLTSVTWHPDSKSIYIGILNRGQDHLQMVRYEIQNGKKLDLIFEENDEKYVEPQFPLYFLPDGSGQFVWLSERDGYRHAYLYDSKGKLIKQLTKGNWVITNILGFDPKGSQMFFTSTRESPLERHLYKVSIRNQQVEKISRVKGTHRGLLSPDGRYLLDVYSNREQPSMSWLLDTKQRHDRKLAQAENPLSEYQVGEMELFSIPASDGTPLYCRLIKPVDFDPNKKYPVIVYVYGGPHAQLITESWMGGANFYLNSLAQQGYAVFTLDNRGSANRGKAFEQIIHRRLGQIELEDQLQGIEYLKNLPWIDATRIGVDGWSYGGFMSISLKLNYPDVFKVAVAGGPVTDWKWYEIMYGERYMDTPQENPSGYEQSSLINQAQKLEGKLLIIHGDMDPVVVWQHSLRFVKACVKAGKQLDYFVYPGHEHNVRGADRAHLIKKISTYFNEFL